MYHNQDTPPKLSGIYRLQYFTAKLFKQIRYYFFYILVTITCIVTMRFGLALTWLYSITISIVICTVLISIKIFRRDNRQIQSTKFFWQSRSLLNRIRFNVNSFRLRTQVTTREVTSRSIILSTLLRISFIRILPSIIVSVLFMLGCWHLNQASNTFQFISVFVNNSPIESASAYDGVLLTILTIIGIFLTLYFTNLNTVMGTLYAELPEKPRQLFLRERVGGISVSFLIFLTIYVLVSLVTGTLFNFRPIIGVIVGASLGALIVPLFAQLSNRAFIYFDPTHFSGELIAELNDWVKNSTTEGYQWTDKSFQYHYFTQAKTVLSAFQTLADISYERPYLRKEGLIKRLIRTLVGYLPTYMMMKRRIPLNSLWYQELLSHKDWYLADYARTLLANQTGTGLYPSKKIDRQWLEREVFQLTEKVTRRFSDDNNIEGATAVLEMLPRAYTSIGNELLLGFGMRSLNNLSNIVISVVSKKQQEQVLTSNEDLLRLRLISNLLILPIHLLLGYFETVRTINVKDIESQIQLLDWKQLENLYNFNLPANTLEGLEDLAPRLMFELEAEGKIVTPHWFSTQATVYSLNITLQEEIENLREMGFKFYIQLASKMLEENYPIMTMLAVSNGMEFLDKLLSHTPELKKLVADMNSVRHVSKMRWVEWHWDEMLGSINTTKKHFGQIVANSIPKLVKNTSKSTDEIPDFLGQALNILSHQYFEALYENEPVHAKNLFHPLFIASLEKYDVLIPKLIDLKADVASFILNSSEPINDLLDLSGYAYLFAKFHENSSLWDHCKEVWVDYASSDEGLNKIAHILSIASLAHKEIGMGSRWQTRNGWWLHFNQMLRQLQPIPLNDPSYGSSIPQYVGKHPDLLIRTLAPMEEFSFGINNDTSISVFAELFLYDVIDAKDGDYSFKDIKRRVEWQRNAEKEAHFVFPSVE